MPKTDGRIPPIERVDVPAGRTTLGVDRGAISFGWDNEFPSYTIDTPAFSIEHYDVSAG